MFGIDTISSQTEIAVYNQATYQKALKIDGNGGVTWENGTAITPNNNGIYFQNTATTTPVRILGNPTNTTIFHVTDNTGSTGLFMVKGATGNVLINTTTDAGFRLDVNGTARVKGTGTTSATTSLRVENSAGINQFSVLDGDGICINSNSDNAAINIQNGGSTRFTIRQNNAILSFRGEATSIGGFNFSNAILNNDPRNSSSLFTINTPTITLTSGTNTYRALTLNYTINTSGGTNEITGLRISPTLTNTTGTTHYAIYSTAGRVRFEGLPTSSAGLNAGEIWNDGGTIRIV
jgi:hypothetical protein